MSLPFSRNTTYTPGSSILSVDLNAIQDAVITNKRGYFYGRMTMTPFFTVGWSTPAAGLSPWIASNAGTNEAWFTLSIESGDLLKGLHFEANGNGVITLQATAWCSFLSGYAVPSPIYSSGAGVPPNSAWGSYQADDVATTFGSGLFTSQITTQGQDVAVVKFVASASGLKLGNVRPILARP